MAGTVSTHSRGTFALTQTLTEGCCKLIELLYSQYRVMSACSLQVAALAHLFILAAVEFYPGSHHALSLITVSGLVLVVMSISQRPRPHVSRSAAEGSHSAYLPSGVPAAAADLSGFVLSPREVALERQSQRLVEIADTAVRSRSEAEQRGHAWADLMSQVSHELRTPLNAVIGFSDVMNAELFGPIGHPRYREYINHIRDSGQALLKSAEDTLALTALLAQPGSASRPEVLELDEFVSDAWSFVSLNGAAEKFTFITSGLTGLDVLGERRPLRQILVNLFSAAIARAASGSTIEITARQDGDVVELEICVSKLNAQAKQNTGALALSVARALLELQETFLIELTGDQTNWRAVTVLPVAVQQDFFNRGGSRCRDTAALRS